MAADGMRPDWAEKDFYAVLGVKKDAEAAEIKKAYRQLARDNHPDSNPDDEKKAETFKKVAEAYDVLGDPEKRTKYDELRRMVSSGGFGGFGGGHGGGFDDLFGQRGGGGFGDVFSDLFGGGGGRPRARARKGQDVQATATISFADAFEGTTVSLRLSSDAQCATCDGSGGKPGSKPKVCATCQGSGQLGGGFGPTETCPTCRGRQLTYNEPCTSCFGSGRDSSSRTVQARVPAGVKDGQKIRLKGKGGKGENGGPAGDLMITVTVGKHPLFGRDGDNLTIEVPVEFHEMVLGAEVKVPVLGGNPVTLKVAPNTPNGRTVRVRGKGVTKRDGTKGDLLVTFVVQVPAEADEQTRAAVEAYREARAGHSVRDRLFEEA